MAMAILSVAVAAIYTSFKGGTDSWIRGQAMSEITQNARIILDNMSREISSAMLSPHTDLDNNTDDQDLVFVGQNNVDSDTLNFTAMLRSPDSSKYKFGLVEIGYSHDSANKKIDRRIDVTPLWNAAATQDTDPLADGLPQDLAYNVTKLNFEYWDSMSTTAWDNGTTKLIWDTRLDTEASTPLTPGQAYDEDKLPKAVKITITVTDEKGIGGPKEYSTIVCLPGSKVF